MLPLSPRSGSRSPYDLVLWTDCSGVLANCSLCRTKATFSFSAGPVCLSFSAEACATLQAPSWSGQHQQVCHFSSLLLLSDSRSVLSSIFPFTSIFRQIWQELFCLSSCSVRLQWVPRHLFLPGNDAADELARRGALLLPFVVPCSLSPLISRIYSSFFLGLEAYCLIKILQHTGSLDFHRETCAPSSCSLCSLSSTLQRTQPTIKLLSLQDWQNRESFLQRLRALVSGNLSSRSALLSYGLLRLSTTYGPGPGKWSGFWGSMVFRNALIPRKVATTITTM